MTDAFAAPELAQDSPAPPVDLSVYTSDSLVVAPYVSFVMRPNFRSPILNTDANGFRSSHAPDGPVDSGSWWQYPRRGIVLGGSFVFGHGATRDHATLVSALNELTPHAYVNLGIIAGNSTQEVIAAIPFLDAAESVVVCSGMNNLAMQIHSTHANELFGPMSFEHVYTALASYPLTGLYTLAKQPEKQARARVLARELANRVRAKLTRPRQPPMRPADEWSVPRHDRAALHAMSARAVALQVRDLTILSRARPAASRLVFALQPFAPVWQQRWQVERLVAMDRGGEELHTLLGYLVAMWSRFATGLAEWCQGEGVPFVDLNDVQYRGDAFQDAVHMTDSGYRQVAEAIAREVRG
jgi:hypothetical protein